MRIKTMLASPLRRYQKGETHILVSSRVRQIVQYSGGICDVFGHERTPVRSKNLQDCSDFLCVIWSYRHLGRAMIELKCREK